MTEAQFKSVMDVSGSCADCSQFFSEATTAMTAAGLMCPLRASAFLSAVQRDTAALTTFHRGADAHAGALLASPASIRDTCARLPAMQTAFASADFAAVCATNVSAPCSCGTDAEAATLAAQPEFAFHVAARWFVAGNGAEEGGSCGDHRLAADVGKGAATPTLTGLYATVACLTSSSADSAEYAARLMYVGRGCVEVLVCHVMTVGVSRVRPYTKARRVFNASYFDPDVDTGAGT